MITELLKQHQGIITALPERIPHFYIDSPPKVMGDLTHEQPWVVLVDFWLYCHFQKLDFLARLNDPEVPKHINQLLLTANKDRQLSDLKKLHSRYSDSFLSLEQQIRTQQQTLTTKKDLFDRSVGQTKLLTGYDIDKLEKNISHLVVLRNEQEYLKNIMQDYLETTRTGRSVLNRYLIESFLEIVCDPYFLLSCEEPENDPFVPSNWKITLENLQHFFSKNMLPENLPHHTTHPRAYRYFSTMQFSFGEEHENVSILGIDLQTHEMIIPEHGLLTFPSQKKLLQFLIDFLNQKANQLNHHVIDAVIDLFRG